MEYDILPPNAVCFGVEAKRCRRSFRKPGLFTQRSVMSMSVASSRYRGTVLSLVLPRVGCTVEKMPSGFSGPI